MDLSHLIKQLYAERDRVSGVIATLETMQQTGSHSPDSARISKRRGRKSMGKDERQTVSERMKKYWETRRPAE